jgi:fibronectin type 3 domain-containing protein
MRLLKKAPFALLVSLALFFSGCGGGSSGGGTGGGGSYEVNLTWFAPTDSSDPVAGYNVYRAPSGGTSYQQINPKELPSTQTSYSDNSVQDGLTYDYIVESVDASGVTSVPSNVASVNIP